MIFKRIYTRIKAPQIERDPHRGIFCLPGLLLHVSVPLLGGVQVLSLIFFCTNRKIQKEVVVLLLLDGDGEESDSGSVSDVVAQEDDVVCGAEKRKNQIRHEKNLLNLIICHT